MGIRTKYIAVEFDHIYSYCMVPEALELVKQAESYFGVVTAFAPVTKKTIKEQRMREYTLDYIRNRVQVLSFYTEHHNKEFDATVDWFDNLRGEGMVTLSNGTRLDIYACNIAGKKTWYPETACVYYSKGQSVRIRVEFSGMTKVFAMGLTAGTFDAEGWDRIKDKNLAFRCNDEGEATTGLFS